MNLIKKFLNPKFKIKNVNRLIENSAFVLEARKKSTEMNQPHSIE